MKKQFRFAAFCAILFGTLTIIIFHDHAVAQSLEEEAKQLHKCSIACKDGDIFTVSKEGVVSMNRRDEGWKKYEF